MDPATLALIGSAASGAGASAVTAYVGRRLRRAQVRQITEEAHTQIYEAYGHLLAELRTDLEAARGEVGRYREELATSRERGDRMAAELNNLRSRLEAAELREAALAAEVRQLTDRADGEASRD
ncbi:hypothetical protein [Salininema proteolyticum]|uniref:Uncharacterized protein n=1 Tax=Salininema proteolyticum TaxID=1607685 RepID=A0ABV8TT06_9ACTN